MELEPLLRSEGDGAARKAALIGVCVGAAIGLIAVAPTLRDAARPLALTFQAICSGAAIGGATGYFFRQIIIGQWLRQSARSSGSDSDGVAGDGDAD